jgi:uncharacterized membrane protein
MKAEKTMFDTALFLDTLRRADFTETQAQGSLAALRTALSDSVATGADVRESENRTQKSIAEQAARTENSISELRLEIKEMGDAISKRLGTQMMVMTGIVAVVFTGLTVFVALAH